MGISDLNVAMTKFRKAQLKGKRTLANYYYQKAETIRASLIPPGVHCKCNDCAVKRWK